MALEKNLELGSGVALSRSYAKVAGVRLDTIGLTAYVTVLIFADQEARAAEKNPVMSCEFAVYSDRFSEFFSIEVLSEEGANPVRNAYLYLKTEDTFAGSIDV